MQLHSKNLRQQFVQYSKLNLDRIGTDFGIDLSFNEKTDLTEAGLMHEIIIETTITDNKNENLQDKLDSLILKLGDKFDFVGCDGLLKYVDGEDYTIIVVCLNIIEHLKRERLRKIANID
ncbi:hypothetical protein [Adhaeribacter soli]|uniref:Uncharacterized protein n=1 Tax=Adhaeribacter soli TaxID=2607655 RepID=A0A5N1IRZ1_9BACT|nr:hypothetical protein [Adhaeribacter soli]KAA9332681.1 hypothetical protein F0P94_11780 [Adhaeribacter soli]